MLPAEVWVLVKTLLLTTLLVGCRRRLPTVRPDLLMEVAWVLVLPLVILQTLVVAIIAVTLN